MKNILFLSDRQGNKTAAIIDLEEYGEFWLEGLEEYSESDFSFLIDEGGKKVAVVLDFAVHGELWEDLCDSLTIEAMKNQPRIFWEEAKRQLEQSRVSV